MAEPDIRQFSPNALREIQRDHTRLKSLVTNLTRRQRVYDSMDSEPIRTITGITSTSTSHPTYPTSGNTYVVKLNDYYFTEATGTNSRTSAGTSSQYVIARTWDGSSVAENSPVICDLIECRGQGFRWWIRPAAAAAGTATIYWAKLDGGNSSGVTPSNRGWTYEGFNTDSSLTIVNGNTGNAGTITSGRLKLDRQTGLYFVHGWALFKLNIYNPGSGNQDQIEDLDIGIDFPTTRIAYGNGQIRCKDDTAYETVHCHGWANVGPSPSAFKLNMAGTNNNSALNYGSLRILRWGITAHRVGDYVAD